MRNAAVIMGVLAGGLGVVLALVTPFLNERAIWALGISLAAILGAVIARSRPPIGAAIMLLSAAAGLFAVLWLWILPAVLLLAAGILVLIDRRSAEAQPA